MAENNKRYFMVTFSGLAESGDLRSGKIEYRTHDNKFVNEKKAIQIITKSFSLEQVFIKQVTEMQESDFNDWIEDRDINSSTYDPDTDDFT